MSLPDIHCIVIRASDGTERLLTNNDGTVTGFLDFDAAFSRARAYRRAAPGAYVVTFAEKEPPADAPDLLLD